MALKKPKSEGKKNFKYEISIKENQELELPTDFD